MKDKLVKYVSPAELSPYHSRFDAIMSDLFNDFWANPILLNDRNWRATSVSVNEEKNQYTVEIELPRFTKDQIKCEVKNGVISIEAKSDKALYTRELALPNIDENKIESKLENGVLTLTINRLTEAKGKVIDIK